jgi:hypothetical protein
VYCATGKYVRVDEVSYDNWLRMNTTVNQEKDNLFLPDSKLVPAVAKKAVSVRFIGVPLWKTADKTLPVDGVIIAGDVINGKAAMHERANLMLDRKGGYSAVYSWSETSGFIHAMSVQMTNGTNSKVDIPLPNTKLLEIIRDRGYGSHIAATDTMTIDGMSYYVSARCANPNTYIDNSRYTANIRTFDNV